MINIKSNVIPNAIWKIKKEIFWLNNAKKHRALKHNAEIVKAEHDFIVNYNPVIYCNDLTGEEWCFDTKLPTGGWLENIKVTYGKDGTIIFKALILC